MDRGGYEPRDRPRNEDIYERDRDRRSPRAPRRDDTPERYFERDRDRTGNSSFRNESKFVTPVISTESANMSSKLQNCPSQSLSTTAPHEKVIMKKKVKVSKRLRKIRSTKSNREALKADSSPQSTTLKKAKEATEDVRSSDENIKQEKKENENIEKPELRKEESQVELSKGDKPNVFDSIYIYKQDVLCFSALPGKELNHKYEIFYYRTNKRRKSGSQ